MKPYVVKQGDYLTKLAHFLGFDAEAVWSDAKNKALKELREDWDMLQAGDILYIPDEPKKRLKMAAAAANAFVAKVPKVAINLLVQEDDEPIKDAKYVIEGLGKELEEFVTDAEGRITFDAPVHIREVLVRFLDRELEMKVGVGDLDPLDTPSGARMRLTQLGFYGAILEGVEQYEAMVDDQLGAAMQAFQQAQNINVTGLFDDLTKKALAALHGS